MFSLGFGLVLWLLQRSCLGRGVEKTMVHGLGLGVLAMIGNSQVTPIGTLLSLLDSEAS